MTSASEMRAILLLTVLAVVSSEETQNFSPFSFIKEIIHYLGDSSESFDISVANKKPTYMQRVPPYQSMFPDFAEASFESSPTRSTLNSMKNESKFPLKFETKFNESTSITPVTVSSTSPKIQNPPYFVTPSTPESTTERAPELHLIPGPPYTSLKFSMAATTTTTTTTRTTSVTSGTPDDLTSSHIIVSPSLVAEVPETHENQQSFSIHSEQGASTVPAKFTLSTKSYQDDSSVFKPQDSVEQTTKSLATSTSQPSTSKQTYNVSPPVKQDVSDSPVQTVTKKTLHFLNAEESTSEFNRPAESTHRPTNTRLNFNEERLSSGNEFTDEFVTGAPSKIERFTLRSTTVAQSNTPPTLQISSTKMPDAVYTKMPDTSYRERGNPELPVKKQNVNLPEMSQEPSKKKFTPFGDAGRSSEVAADSPCEQCKSSLGSERSQCFRGRCSQRSLTHSRCDSSNIPSHHLHSEGFMNSQAPVNRPPRPVFVQQRPEDDMALKPGSSHRSEILVPKEVSSPVSGGSAPTLQVFAYPSHPSLSYYDARPQVSDYEAVPYFIGTEGARHINTCQTCRRLPQFYPLLPMQPIQPL